MKLNTVLLYFLRYSLGVAFLSAVADRFGYWGPAGASHVAWGNFQNFTAYTAVLNPLAPASTIPALAWIATVLEVILGMNLLIGLRVKESAFASGVLLVFFGLSMTLALSIKEPLNYSVFSAAAAAFALASLSSSKNVRKK